ncbi:MAG: hypothetical protein ACOCUD_02710 [Bacillota bacterium]
MEKTKRWIKNNLIFFISLIILFLSVVFSAIILTEYKIQSDLESTRVGHIYLGSDKSNYENRLNNEISQFLSEADYEIKYQNETYNLDFAFFEFSEQATINNITKNTNNIAYFNLTDSNNFEINLRNVFGNSVINSINFDELVSDILSQLGKLDYYNVFSLTNYFTETSINTIILEETYPISNQNIVNDLSLISDITIKPLEQFSLLNEVSEYNISNESLSFLASMIQDLTLETHFNNYIFQSYNILPSWANETMNIKILKTNNFDFSFYNSFDQEYKFIIEIIDSTTIKLKLEGMPYVYTYTIEETTTSIPYDTIYIDDPDLEDITYKVNETDTEITYQKLLESGSNGSLHTFVRTITYNDDSTESIILYYIKFASTPEIIAENIVTKAGD